MKNEIINIEGLTCHHCEARVKKVIEDIEGVQSCNVSSKFGTADCEFDETKTTKDTLVRAIYDAGYEVK